MARIRSRIQALMPLCFVRAASMLALVLAGTLSLASEDGEIADGPHHNSAAELSPVLNELMIGCSQDGTTNFLRQRGGFRIEPVNGNGEGPRTKPFNEYDEAYVIRLGNRSDDTWSPDKVCLYFRDGCLAYKCVVPDETVDLHQVFRREIKSGLQHPPNYPDLMDKVQWGRAAEPHIEQLAADTFERIHQPTVSLASRKQPESPKVRCGIAVKGLPAFATRQGNNLLVVYQNMGPSDLTDEMLLGYPANPGIMVTAKYADHEQSIGYPGNFGIYGAKVYRWRDGDEVKDVRRAPFRLRSGEATYMWFQVPNLESCVALQARTIWLRGATKQGDRLIVRDWDADSPKISTTRPVRTCSGITE